jgi:hypothetical protein
VALALCEPLLRGSLTPATYSEVSTRLGWAGTKRARTATARLIALYADRVHTLSQHIHSREESESAALALTRPPILRHGIWTFASERSAGEEIAAQDRLRLPDYHEVAHFLVLRAVVLPADLAELDPTR